MTAGDNQIDNLEAIATVTLDRPERLDVVDAGTVRPLDYEPPREGYSGFGREAEQVAQ